MLYPLLRPINFGNQPHFTPAQLERSRTYVPILTYYPERDYSNFQFDDYGVHCAKPLSYPKELLNRLPKEITDNISIILDPCSSVGTTAIGFALAGKKVIASDISPERINLAKHNAYEVCHLNTSQIEFTVADAVSTIQSQSKNADCIFLDPTFGEHEKKEGHYFSLNALGEFGTNLIKEALKTNKLVILTLPKSIDTNELRALVQSKKFDSTRDIGIYWIRTNQYGKLEFSTIVFFPPKNAPIIPVQYNRSLFA